MLSVPACVGLGWSGGRGEGREGGQVRRPVSGWTVVLEHAPTSRHYSSALHPHVTKQRIEKILNATNTTTRARGTYAAQEVR